MPDPSPIDDATNEQLKELEPILRHMIDHIAKRIEYAESRRNVQVTIAAAWLASSVGLLTLALNKIDWFPLWLSLVVFSVVGILCAGLTFLMHARQVNYRYPFTQVTKTWKWFYRYALPDISKYSTRWFRVDSKTSIEQAKEQFTKGWPAFRAQNLGLSDKKINVSQDLEQIYLLHVNECYKNTFLTQLRSLLSYGLTAAIFLSVAAFGIACLVNPPPTSSRGTVATKDYAVDSAWRRTGSTRATGAGGNAAQLLINLKVRNKSTSASLTVKAIVPEDSLGMRIPMAVESMDPPTLVIPPNTTADAVLVAWTPESLTNTLYHFQIQP